ncbi:protein kinase domain-containing protein [Blastopirellula retiformator]|uniref:Serine/threonine-protein kinase PrkC n=1 Tax=Blastopirellula retiformator TaxID=2527970 RepID=A0A5C5V9M2_9BACT|nr:protein kinase [Blastopirellula retiformator]TWT34623.1 Serine/threonine-protein kinase PrkC [Blastopirellula retiformator]
MLAEDITTDCPDARKLSDFLLGLLSDEESSLISQHIDQCDVCCKALEQIPDDHLASLARRATQVDVETLHNCSGDTDALGGTIAAKAGAQQPNQFPAELIDHPRYRLIQLIGFGGMGEVYRAEHRVMNREVALKVVRKDLVSSPEAISRFRNEVRAASMLSHPNIVTALDAERIGQSHVLAMELVNGSNLAEVVAENGPLDVDKAVDMIRQIASGLDHAHSHQMAHRDLKPMNVLLDRDGRARILDFGLATVRQDLDGSGELPQASVGLTSSMMRMGTPDYMSPEQAKDPRSADIRSDIYSLGCTFFFLLFGKPPFDEATAIEKLSSHLLVEPTIPESLPSHIADVLRRMLAKSPEQRYQTPSQLLQALDQLSAAPIPSKPIRAARVPKPLVQSVLAGILALVALGSVGLLVNNFRSDPNALGVPASPTATQRVLVVAPMLTYLPDYTSVKEALADFPNIEVVTASDELNFEAEGDNAQLISVQADLTLAQVDAQQFDAVVFIGGDIKTLLVDESVRSQVERIVGAIRRKQGIVAGICGGVHVLGQLDELTGFRVAGNRLPEVPDLEAARTIADFRKQVVADRGVVTATDPEWVDRFAGELVRSMGGSQSKSNTAD